VIEHRPDLRLVLAGPAPEPELRALASVPTLEPRVSFVVDPDDEELAELYNGATLFLFPSIYEGFGWPPLEAAYYGCPVVCSRAASLPEVVGDAALMCDPGNTSGFASAVIHLMSDQLLARKLIENGYRNLKRFDDRRLGLGLSELYVKLIEKGAVWRSL
jgi:glycosyltransferase involved in cell wall biosynthesis